MEKTAYERAAVLDVGSNSVRLLVADVHGGLILPVFEDRVSSRLLAGWREGRLCAQSIERTAQAIESLAQAARERGAGRIWAFGTSAMRDSENARPLIERAARAGVCLRVISGEEEARLAYAGAAPSGRAGVIDIGGGSTELLCGADGRVLGCASARMGAVRLFETRPGSAQAAVLRAKEALETAYRAVRSIPVDRFIGQGGTITTLAAMDLRLETYDRRLVEGHALSRETAAAQLALLDGMTPQQRAALPGLTPARADIIVCGAAIVCAFFEISGCKALYATDRDNLLGYLTKQISENGSKGLDNKPKLR